MRYLLITITTFLLASSTHAQEEKIKSRFYYQMPLYGNLLKLDPPKIPDSLSIAFEWAHINVNIQNGKQKGIAYVTSGGISQPNAIFSENAVLSSTVFDQMATNYQRQADQEIDLKARSEYRQMSIAAQQASIANMEMQQQFERTMAGLQLAATVMQVAEALYQNWVTKDMYRSITYGFGEYEKAESLNQHLIKFRAIEQHISTKKEPFRYLLTLEASLTVDSMEITLPPRELGVIFHKKKQVEELSPPEGYANARDTYVAFELEQFTGIKQNYWLNQLIALMVRQVAYDYLDYLRLSQGARAD